MTDRIETVRAYYQALDRKEYGEFETLLAPEFAHRRPDRSLVGREAFVGFVRDDRPQRDTSHEIEEIYTPDGRTPEVVARGTLRNPDDEELFAFVDVFRFDEARLVALNTYTR